MRFQYWVGMALLFCMAAGSARADDLVALVYGQDVHRADISIPTNELERWKGIKTEKEIAELQQKTQRFRLLQIILGHASAAILGKASLEPTEDEMHSFRSAIPETKEMAAIRSKLTPEQRKNADAGLQRAAYEMVRVWKLNKRLYQKYGGRVAFQQAGPEPVDAYLMFFEDIVKSGKVEIVAPEFKSVLTDMPVAKNQLYMKEKDARTAFDTPWWVKKKQ